MFNLEQSRSAQLHKQIYIVLRPYINILSLTITIFATREVGG